MKGIVIKIGIYLFVLIVPFSNVIAQFEDSVSSVITKAVDYAGGADTWKNNSVLKVHEFQKRYEDGGVVIVDVTHTMNTNGNGYRMELSRQGKDLIYGWDGMEFWAMIDGHPGTDDDISEARRQISNAYFRFSLPFVLQGEIDEITYEGTDKLYGANTQVVKITYENGLADTYFQADTGGHDDHSDSDVSGHSSENNHESGSEHQVQVEHGGRHHHGGEEYFFHFAENGELKKVYFSHHGDGSYETLLYKNNKMVNGIVRDNIRVLLNPDGNIHYESFFSEIGFINNVSAQTYKRP